MSTNSSATESSTRAYIELADQQGIPPPSSSSSYSHADDVVRVITIDIGDQATSALESTAAAHRLGETFKQAELDSGSFVAAGAQAEQTFNSINSSSLTIILPSPSPPHHHSLQSLPSTPSTDPFLTSTPKSFSFYESESISPGDVGVRLFSPHSPSSPPPPLHQFSSPPTLQYTPLSPQQYFSPAPLLDPQYSNISPSTGNIFDILSCTPTRFREMPVRRNLFPEWQPESLLLQYSGGWTQFGECNSDGFDHLLAGLAEVSQEEEEAHELATPQLVPISREARMRLFQQSLRGRRTRNAASSSEPPLKRMRVMWS